MISDDFVDNIVTIVVLCTISLFITKCTMERDVLKYKYLEKKIEAECMEKE